jgi:hypothetical protein
LRRTFAIFRGKVRTSPMGSPVRTGCGVQLMARRSTWRRSDPPHRTDLPRLPQRRPGPQSPESDTSRWATRSTGADLDRRHPHGSMRGLRHPRQAARQCPAQGRRVQRSLPRQALPPDCGEMRNGMQAMWPDFHRPARRTLLLRNVPTIRTPQPAPLRQARRMCGRRCHEALPEPRASLGFEGYIAWAEAMP